MKTEAVRLTWSSRGEERVKVFNQDRIVIGRSESCDFRVREEKVSRQHATIIREGFGWAIFDMQSANGTMVNDRDRPIVKTRLRHADTIWLGEVAIRFELPEERERSNRSGVVFDASPLKKNRTAIFDMSALDLGGESPVSTVTTSPGSGSREAARAIALFNDAAQTLLRSEDLEQMLGELVELVFRNMAAERGVVALWDAQAETIEPRVTRTREGSDAATIRLSRTVAMEAIQNRQAFLVDAGEPARPGAEDSLSEMGVQSAMCAPIFSPGVADRGVIGILYVDSTKRARSFDQEDLRLLSTLAAFTAVAFEQRSLMDDLRFERDCRDRLSKYNSKGVVERILASPVQKTGMHMIGGMMTEEREVTVIFADLVGFTAMSESMSPQETAQLLNEVFEILTGCVFELDGTLDKFMGDGMMAFFGAPMDQDDHAVLAVQAALAMQQRIAALERGSGMAPLRVRVGINSGPVVAGDIGTPERKDYTVIGDTVNVASRLESTVAQPGQVVVGPATAERVKHAFRCRALEPVPLKGKTRPVQAWLVEGPI